MGRREAFLLRSLRFFAGKNDRRLFGLGLILGPQTATVRRGPAQPRRHLAIRSTPRHTHECTSGFSALIAGPGLNALGAGQRQRQRGVFKVSCTRRSGNGFMGIGRDRRVRFCFAVRVWALAQENPLMTNRWRKGAGAGARKRGQGG